MRKVFPRILTMHMRSLLHIVCLFQTHTFTMGPKTAEFFVLETRRVMVLSQCTHTHTHNITHNITTIGIEIIQCVLLCYVCPERYSCWKLLERAQQLYLDRTITHIYKEPIKRFFSLSLYLDNLATLATLNNLNNLNNLDYHDYYFIKNKVALELKF